MEYLSYPVYPVDPVKKNLRLFLFSCFDAGNEYPDQFLCFLHNFVDGFRIFYQRHMLNQIVCLLVFHSTLDVRCSMFDVRL